MRAGYHISYGSQGISRAHEKIHLCPNCHNFPYHVVKDRNMMGTRQHDGTELVHLRLCFLCLFPKHNTHETHVKPVMWRVTIMQGRPLIKCFLGSMAKGVLTLKLNENEKTLREESNLENNNYYS